eukprot:72754_1
MDIVGHRGGSLRLIPQHTIGSWSMGVQGGAEYIESDILMSKDGYLLSHHDMDLSVATNVADHPEFADRYTTFTVYNRGDPNNYTWYTPDDMENIYQTYTGWPLYNFTLAELKTLKCINTYQEWTNGYESPFNGYFDVLTFNESLQLLNNLSLIFERDIGIFPEPKYYTWYKTFGYGNMVEKMISSLERYGFLYYDDEISMYKPNMFNDSINNKSLVIFQSQDPSAFVEYNKYVYLNNDIPSYISLGFVGDDTDINRIEWALTFSNGFIISLDDFERVNNFRQEIGINFPIHIWVFMSDQNEYIKAIDYGSINSVFSRDTSTGVNVKIMMSELVDADSEINNLNWIYCNRKSENESDTSMIILFSFVGLIMGIIITWIIVYVYYNKKYEMVAKSTVMSVKRVPTSETPLVESK